MEISFLEGFLMGWEMFWSILTADPLFSLALVLFFGGSLLFAFAVKAVNQYRLKKSGILEVDKMSGKRFEEYLYLLFKAKGYNSSLTPTTADYGADLILTSRNKKIVVQAKRYKSNVGVKAVQEVVSAKSYYKADECWVVTNSSFTANAKKLANSNHVRLVDRAQLMDWMIKEKKGA